MKRLMILPILLLASCAWLEHSRDWRPKVGDTFDQVIAKVGMPDVVFERTEQYLAVWVGRDGRVFIKVAFPSDRPLITVSGGGFDNSPSRAVFVDINFRAFDRTDGEMRSRLFGH